MNPKGKKFISLFLVFSLMMLSANLYAKERRGAKLIITKKDGQLIEGELIAVKDNSLLLLSESGADVSIDISEIKVIKIKKKSQGRTGALAGLFAGVTFGFAISEFGDGCNITGQNSSSCVVLVTLLMGWIGMAVGGIIGEALGIDKTIQIEGMTDWEIKDALDKLNKKARIRDYK